MAVLDAPPHAFKASAARLKSVFCSDLPGKRRTAEDATSRVFAFIHVVSIVINQYSVLQFGIISPAKTFRRGNGVVMHRVRYWEKEVVGD
jgi:hypothetical protein